MKKNINRKVFVLMHHCVKENIVNSEGEFLLRIGAAAGDLKSYRYDSLFFTHEHIYNACKLSNSSPNWIYGFSKEMIVPEFNGAADLIEKAKSDLEDIKEMLLKAAN